MNQDELKHYGILGMKWGSRKSNPSYQAYKQSKKDFKQAKKAVSKSSFGFGIKGIDRYEKAKSNKNKAEIDMIIAKAKYKASKAKTADKADKAEFKTYKKEMNKSGLANSMRDAQKGGRSARLYDKIKIEKGKAYADKVQKSLEKKYIKNMVGSAVVAIGSTATLVYLNNKR